MAKTFRIKRTKGQFTFDMFNVGFMILWALITFYPFWYILALSFNTGADAAKGPIWLWPREFTLENYKFVLGYDELRTAFFITIARCILAPTFSVFVTILSAFALSKRFLPRRKAILTFFLIPTFIGGTMISNFVVIAKLGLLNNFLVYIIPGGLAFFNMVIMRTHIEALPIELQESAMLDGAGYTRIFFQIILPLCKPVLAAFLFFGVVGSWLDYYTNLIYIQDRSLITVQYLLYEIIQKSEAANIIDFASKNPQIAKRILTQQNSTLPTPEVIKMAVMVVVTFPILFIYPFFQQYFVEGTLTGAVKA